MHFISTAEVLKFQYFYVQLSTMFQNKVVYALLASRQTSASLLLVFPPSVTSGKNRKISVSSTDTLLRLLLFLVGRVGGKIIFLSSC